MLLVMVVSVGEAVLMVGVFPGLSLLPFSWYAKRPSPHSHSAPQLRGTGGQLLTSPNGFPS